jgi:arylsulfatase
MALTRRDFLASAAAASSVSAAPSARPNILLLFPDELRHDFTEPSSSIPVRTPVVKRLAEEGVRFTRAITPAPLCAPARACLASGREYDNCGVASNQYNYPLDQRTFYQLLRKSGYHVMGCGKFDLHKPELDWGLDGKRLIHDWGFSDGIDNEGKSDGTAAYKRNGKPMGPFLAYLEKLGLAREHVADYERRKGHDQVFPTPLTDEAYGDNWIARNAISLLDAAPKDSPWYLQVNFNGPHPPWDITRAMEKRWRGTKFPGPDRGDQFTPDVHDQIRQNYAAMIENIDRRCGEIIDKVKARGELDKTLIVFSSDHGEMLGDRNLWGKLHPFHASVGVPLVVRGLDVRKGVTCGNTVSTVDLPATFLDWAGVERPGTMDSRSLRDFLTKSNASLRDNVLAGMGEWRQVNQGRYKYIRGWGKEPMLYDLVNDPTETENLVTTKPKVAAEMSRLLPAVRPARG